MKKYTAPIALLIIGFFLGIAYKNFTAPPSFEGKPPKRLERQLQRYSSKLNLSEEQRKQVREIFQDSRDEIHQARETLRPKMGEIRRKTREKIRAILTEEQKQKFNELHSKKEKRLRKFKRHSKR